MNNTEVLLNQLIDCLAREDGLLAGLVVAAEAQKAALSHNELAAIKATAERVNALASELAALEAERVPVQTALEEQLGLAPGSALVDIILHTTGKAGEALAALLREMREKARLLREANEINTIMTRRAVVFNRLILKTFDPAAELTYRDDGAVRQGKPTNPFLNKTV